MRHNSERTAWTVLLSAFVVCSALATLLPFTTWRWLRTATTAQVITLSSSGTVQVKRPGSSEAVVNPDGVIPVGSTITTQQDSQATLNFTSREGRALTNVVIYGDTEIILTQADSPRFRLGLNPHQVLLTVTSGRVRAIIGQAEVDRAVRVAFLSRPDAWTVLQAPGSNASLEATFTESIVTVREGEATVIAHGQA
ncbi:MAG: hypothetical protein ACRDH2_19120, partial [Anaerolineales bacterium]